MGEIKRPDTTPAFLENKRFKSWLPVTASNKINITGFIFSACHHNWGHGGIRETNRTTGVYAGCGGGGRV